MRRKIACIIAVLFALLMLAACGGGGDNNTQQQPSLPKEITRVSVSTSGAEANNDSSFAYSPAISGDGRYVAFYSLASNLVTGDTNTVDDVFVRDVLTNTTTRISVATGGVQGNGYSYNPSISSDGRYVAFESTASNLVTGDTNTRSDIFVHDRQTGTTTRVSVATDGTQSDGNSSYPSISGNGRFVAFKSAATNLVTGDTNGVADIFVRDRDTDNDGIFDETGAVSTTRVSISTASVQANGICDNPVISGNGRYVAFISTATNLVTSDGNSATDVFVRDLQSNTTVRVSVATGGTEAVTSSGSLSPAISSDGRYVVFESYATNLVTVDMNGYLDIFMRDRDTDNDGIFDEAGAVSTTLVSENGGTQTNQHSYNPSISSDGQYIAFESSATTLIVSGDTNSAGDIYVRELATGTITRSSLAADGTQGDLDSMYPAISGDGKYVAFVSDATNLVPGDTSNNRDVFVTPVK